MTIKESNLYFANELSHSFFAGIPDITNRSIRIPAFDFGVFEKDVEDFKHYESAMLVFEDVVSSTRYVRTWTSAQQVEGQVTYEIADGPFDLIDSTHEFFQFKFEVYGNSARVWIEWNIVAATTRLAEIDKEVLIDLAKKRGVKPAIANSVFEDMERKAVHTLLEDMKLAADYRLILPLYCEELIETAKRKNRLLDIADLLIEKPNRALLKLADELSTYHTEGCASLIRDIIAAGYDASGALINALYRGDSGVAAALLDTSEPDRILAAKTVEAQDKVPGLIICLQNAAAS